MTESSVYAVHVLRVDELAVTQLVCRTLAAAEKYAREFSDDPGVLAGAVTQFVLDEAGRRTPIALYLRGMRQQLPHVSDDREIYACGEPGWRR